MTERIEAGSPARPLNVAIWGGQTDLAQALWQAKRTRGEAGAEGAGAALSKAAAMRSRRPFSSLESVLMAFPIQAPISRHKGGHKGCKTGFDHYIPKAPRDGPEKEF